MVERLVEVAAHLEHPGAVHEGLGQLAQGDVALGDEHHAGQAGPRRVGGRRGRGVARRRAHDRLGALLDRLGDGHGHAAVLERPGRVGALDLQPDLGADPLGEARRRQQRRAALEQGDHRASRSVPAGRSRYSSITPAPAAVAARSRHAVLVADDAQHAADPVDRLEPAQLVDGGQQVALAGHVGEEDQPGLVGQADLLHRPDGHAVVAEDLGHRGQHAGRSATSMLR